MWHQDDDLFCRMTMEQSASTVWPFSIWPLFYTLEVTFKKENSASQFVVLKVLFVAGCAHGRLCVSGTMQLMQSYCRVCQHLTAQLLCLFQLFLLLEISRILPKSAANVASRGDSQTTHALGPYLMRQMGAMQTSFIIIVILLAESVRLFYKE